VSSPEAPAPEVTVRIAEMPGVPAESTAAQAPAPAERASADEPPAPSPEAPAPEAVLPDAPAPEPDVSASTAPEVPSSPAAQANEAAADAALPITCVNIMQVLVDENAEKYIQMFGLCKCPRCKADIKALALNDLPPKYVVMEKGQVVPRISVYEGRYQAAVTAQILRACKTVTENPRNDQPY
jgi:hypothetical protein